MNNLFDEILMTTAELAGVNVTAIPVSNDPIKRWNDIVKFWNSRPNIFKAVFYKALRHFAMGKYVGGSSEIKTLLTLVEKAIKDEDDAVKAWETETEFFESVKKIDSGIGSKCFWGGCPIIRYRWYTFRLYTIYRKYMSKTLNVKTLSQEEVNEMEEARELRLYCDCYEKSIAMLIPDSQHWTCSEKSDQSKLVKAIKKIHKVDYSKNIVELSRLIVIMIFKLNDEEYYTFLFNVTSLPDSIATAIWSTNMAEELAKQFIMVSNINPNAKRGKVGFPSDIIRSSWVYKKLLQFEAEKNKAITKNVKKYLFDFGMDNHPYLEKIRKRRAKREQV